MVDSLASVRHQPEIDQRRAAAKRGPRSADTWIAATALLAAIIALPLARSSWHSPEVASVLAVSAVAMLAQQRWALALVVLAELLLLPTLVPRVLLAPDLLVRGTGLVAVTAMVPGVLASRRAAGALVHVAGWPGSPLTRRRLRAALIASGILTAGLPLF